MNVEDFNNLVVHDIIIDDIGDAIIKQERIPRDILDKRDAFSITDHKFTELFRLTKDVTREVIDIVTPFVMVPRRESALTITTKLRATLRFFAGGNYQEVTGSNCFVGISQALASRAINEVTNALNRPEILSRFIGYPQTIEELEAFRTRFFQKYGMPGVVGVLIVVHSIVASYQNDANFPEHIYVNRKLSFPAAAGEN